VVDIAGVDPQVVAEVQDEVVQLLVDLIKIDTSNPPGNETQTALFLDKWFKARGLEGQLVGEPEHRKNFILRVDGTRPGPTLVLLAHMDVVPAEPESWSEPPFGGVIKDDHIWGRGAGDIKNLVAAHAVAVSRLAASGRDFAGSVIYAATADEEEGTDCGARWLVQNRPDLVKSDYLLNEGGGEYDVLRGQRVYEINTGEKGTAQFRITVHGEAGHASVPLHKGNAVVSAAQIVLALYEHRAEVHMDHLPPEYVRLLIEDEDLCARLLDAETARAALAELHESDDAKARLLEPHYGITFSPTIVHSTSEAINVFPEQVVVTVDCRTLAGRGEDEVRMEVDRALAGIDAQWELEFVGSTMGNASAVPTPFSEAIERVMQRCVPGCRMVSLHCVGFTDSNWFRAAFPDVVAYGYGPYIEEPVEFTSEQFHNHDERIHVKDLAFQAVFAEELVKELLK
jgi:acetylornithine deacetylase/succinyl-diaminopimelate desuccinylase-like protein